MNILIFAKQNHIGGLTHHCGLLAQGLSEHMKANVVLGMTPGEGTTELSKRFKVELFKLGGVNPFSWLADYRKLAKIVKQYQINIIQAENRIPALLAAMYCKRHKDVKYIWANHLVPIPDSKLFRILTHYGYCAVAEGIAGREMLISNLGIPGDKVRIVNLGIDLSKFHKTLPEEQEKLKEAWGIKPDKKVVLLYGRLSENKGHLFLLDSLKGIDNRNYYLVFPGKNPEFKSIVDEKALQMGLTENIIYPGFINGPEWLSISDLMVLPSKNEGFPQACIEAYAMRVPVIRTKSGGYEDTKEMCYGIDYGDVKAFEKMLQDFLDGGSYFAERAKNAKKAVHKYSIEQMAKEYYGIYEEALSE